MKEDLFSVYEKLRKEIIQKSNLNALAKDLSPYNLIDILSKIGALSLMPENGSHLARLEALAAAAITNLPEKNNPKISKPQFQRMLNRHLGLNSSVTQLEDSCENLFTESTTFFDGSNIIFPGLLASASFILRNICRGLFLLRQSNENQEFKSSIYLEIMTLLALSDEIARRANLKRGIFPSTKTWDENIRVPKSKLLGELQTSVVFSKNELEKIFASRKIPIACIEPYLSIPGNEKLLDNDFDSSGIYTKPIVKIDDKYVVLISGLLISATIHRILSLAVELGAVREFVEAYRAATCDNVQASLKLLDIFPVSKAVLFGAKKQTQWLEQCYQIDTDKLLYTQYFTDDLKNYDVDKPFSELGTKKIPKLIIERQEQVLKQIYQELPSINDVVWLILTQGYGRPFQFQLRTSKLKCPTLALTVAELEIIGFSERGDRLAIWKYLKHKIQVREKRPVISTSEIDEFEFYRSFKHSYPLPDDIDGIIHIKPGTGGDLIRKVYSELDLHGIIGDQPHTVAEVISSINSDFPVSIVSGLSHTRDYAAIAVEQFSIPVWIIGQKYTDPLEYATLHPLYTILGDSIGYWLWQAKDFMATLINSLSSKIDRLLIEISLQPSETWQQLPIDFKEPDAVENVQEHISVKTHCDEATIRIEIKESIKTWLVSRDNRIERELINLVFQSIRDLNKEITGNIELLPTNEEIWEAIDLYIPQGIRKTIIMLPVQDPRYDSKLIPEVRLIQEADEIDVSKDIRKYLISNSSPNSILKSRESKTKLLNGIVAYLYMELERTISSLKSSDLLEFLLAQHEATVHKYFADRLKIPLQLESFYSSQGLIKKLEEETPRLTHTSMALRFLIEYVSACSPHGLRSISYEVFDRLITLSAEIIILGTISDRIHYEIDDTSVEIKSGLLSIDQDSFYAAFKSFIPNYFEGLIGRSVKHFDEPWQRLKYSEPKQIQNDLDNKFGMAFLAEFGLSFDDYQIICGQMVVLGYEQNNPAKYMPRDQLIAKVAKETNIPYETVLRTIDSITLKERHKYLKPPPGYEDWEVYPWKVNRNLSFLRKPLIQRGEEQGILWGNRHLIHSVEFLYNHCYSGKLKEKTQIMKEFISDIRNEDGKAFNDEIFNAFAEQTGVVVRKRIDCFCRTEMFDAKGKLGDIDVFVVNNSKDEILTIECKNLNAAISPYEYNNELKSLFIDDEEEDSEATKLIRRAKWVENHIELVLREMNLASKKGWKYRPLIITSEELFTPYLKETSVKTISLRKLLEEFIPSWIR